MKKVLGFLKIYGIITFGAFLAALGISLFFAPVNLVAGGLSGIGVLVHGYTGFPVGLLMLLLNIPLFILGYKHLGSGFLFRSMYGAFIFSVLTDVLSFFPAITNNLMLCALFGGGLVGIGMGIIFLTGATTGGSDIAAHLLHRLFPGLDVGKWLLVTDGVIILCAAFAAGHAEACLYGVIAATTNSILIDLMIQGANFAKVVYIVSPKAEQIAQETMRVLDRGATGLYCKRMYTQKDGLVLLCVIKKHEIPKLKKIVLAHDPTAFIIFTGARSVSGEGFKNYPIN
ncbi:MAG: YitT family protein [Ruminococcaceae bacterium]|nr:YitT family protein [Oscillospiraceae bacterium]